MTRNSRRETDPQGAPAPKEPRTGGRQGFLKTLAAGAVAAVGQAAMAPGANAAAPAKVLQVWSCGGLAEAMKPAHDAYRQTHGVEVAYTGAFAAALGKSLLSGSGHTEVFAERVPALAKTCAWPARCSISAPCASQAT